MGEIPVSEFEKHTTTKKLSDGSYECSCNKGLFSASAPTIYQAKKEAVHYFMQYWDDGEYDGTLKERLMSKIKNPLDYG